MARYDSLRKLERNRLLTEYRKNNPSLSLKEIGEVMSISESRVSQIHTKAVLKLRGMIREKFALSG